MSGRVGEILTVNICEVEEDEEVEEEGKASLPIFDNKVQISSGASCKAVTELMYALSTCMSRVDRSGVMTSLPSGKITLTGSTVKGLEQYCANMVTIMLMTMASLVSSVAVVSMKTSVVSKVIFVWSELMIGGIDKTCSEES